MNDKKKLIITIVLALAVLLILVKITGCEKPSSISKDNNIKITKNEASSLELEEYKSDVFSMKKPKGWTVEAGGSGIYYAIKVTDPKDERNQIFLMLKMQPLLKSQSAKDSWNEYYKLSNYQEQYKLFSTAVVLENPTTLGFYQKFNEIGDYMNSVEPTLSTFKFPKYSNFNQLEEFESKTSMKSVSLDSKVLRATYTNENNKEAEGMFTASIVNFGDQNNGNVDMSYYMVYDIMSITSVKDEFINYKELLMNSINSIEFSDAYVKKTIDDGNAQTKQALQLNASIQAAFDSYMNAWENRSKSYDIMSQKQSDATLGYERVYDTDTGEIYKAYNGFTDDYDGEQYKPITDDMYTNRVYGYIEK